MTVDAAADPAIVAPSGAKFKITDTKLYVPVVTLSKENDIKLLEQLKLGFKRSIKWNKYRLQMPIYNVIEYSDNYSDISGRLWGFKRDEIDNNANVTNNDNAPLFKYKASLIGNARKRWNKKWSKIAVPLKYLSNFWRSLEMPLINCKIELSLKWIENCILSSSGTAATFKITDTKLYVPIVTLKAEDNTKLSKLLSKGFKRPVYWNKYKVTEQKNSRNCS